MSESAHGSASESSTARVGRNGVAVVYGLVVLVALVAVVVHVRRALGPASVSADLPEFLSDVPPGRAAEAVAARAGRADRMPGAAPALATTPPAWAHEPQIEAEEADRFVSRTFVVHGTVTGVEQQGERWVLAFGTGRHSFCVSIPGELGVHWPEGAGARFLHRVLLVHGKIVMADGRPIIRLRSASDVSMVP